MPVVRALKAVFATRTALLIGASVALVSLLSIAAALLIIAGRSGKDDDARAARALSAEFAPLPVPASEQFLPPEPDFLPRVILSRERRTAWTLSDAEPYWTDPATLDLSLLYAGATAVVDGIMERTP